MGISIEDIQAQLLADVEATNGFLISALERGDTKAVRVWQRTLAAAEAALEAVTAYRKDLDQ